MCSLFEPARLWVRESAVSIAGLLPHPVVEELAGASRSRVGCDETARGRLAARPAGDVAGRAIARHAQADTCPRIGCLLANAAVGAIGGRGGAGQVAAGLTRLGEHLLLAHTAGIADRRAREPQVGIAARRHLARGVTRQAGRGCRRAEVEAARTGEAELAIGIRVAGAAVRHRGGAGLEPRPGRGFRELARAGAAARAESGPRLACAADDRQGPGKVHSRTGPSFAGEILGPVPGRRADPDALWSVELGTRNSVASWLAQPAIPVDVRPCRRGPRRSSQANVLRDTQLARLPYCEVMVQPALQSE